jgi:hypothetical protein
MFESQGGERGFSAKSPGGFEFGVQGWTWGDPIPKSITFFTDNTAVVADQYGRNVRGALLSNGLEVRFADRPPDGSKEGVVVPRPEYATHEQVLQALKAEGIDWLAYEVRYVTQAGARTRGGLTLKQAQELQVKVVKDGARQVTMDRSLSCAGWPQLSYDELKKMPEVPPTPREELIKIRDPKLRRDALRLRSEADAARAEELELVGAEEE